jgi:hypothetical protein
MTGLCTINIIIIVISAHGFLMLDSVIQIWDRLNKQCYQRLNNKPCCTVKCELGTNVPWCKYNARQGCV